MQRKANAIWKGGLKDGKGVVSASSGVLSNTPYSFATRFENTPGTNPEELIAAAHAGCFSMALSGQLGAANLTASSIETTATLTLEKLEELHIRKVLERIPNLGEAAAILGIDQATLYRKRKKIGLE